jgi:hypothetical protein
MKQRLEDLGNGDWTIQSQSEEKIREPDPGTLLTVDVLGYGRQCTVFFPQGKPRPKLLRRVRIRIKNGKVIFPIKGKG